MAIDETGLAKGQVRKLNATEIRRRRPCRRCLREVAGAPESLARQGRCRSGGGEDRRGSRGIRERPEVQAGKPWVHGAPRQGQGRVGFRRVQERKACYSAWLFDADRRSKQLTLIDTRGSSIWMVNNTVALVGIDLGWSGQMLFCFLPGVSGLRSD